MNDADEKSEELRCVRRFERRLPHAPEKVWRALTDPKELAHWFPEGEWGPHAGKIIAWDPPHLLSYTFGDETLRWELLPTAEGCTLVLETSYPEPVHEDANDNGIVPPRACAMRLAA